MKKSTLVFWSVARDALDFVGIGQVPGLNWMLNLPILILHFRYAGLRALITLFENVPIVETLPLFTAAALSYPNLENILDESRDRKFVAAKVIEDA